MEAERVADTLSWYSTVLVLPITYSTSCAIAAARNLTSALRNPSPASPLRSVPNNEQTVLEQSTNFQK